MKKPLSVAAFVALACVALAGDLASKHYVFNSLLNDSSLQGRLQPPAGQALGATAARAVLGTYQRQICPGVSFTLSVNPGVVFGLPMPRLLVAAATVLTVTLVCYFFATSTDRLVLPALALILGGAMGNLYDRLFSVVAMEGFEPIRYHVRDFIDCSGLHYPWVFNLADAWLVIGVALLALHWWLVGRHEAKRQKASGQNASR